MDLLIPFSIPAINCAQVLNVINFSYYPTSCVLAHSTTINRQMRSFAFRPPCHT
jgi:hypothetical protein